MGTQILIQMKELVVPKNRPTLYAVVRENQETLTGLGHYTFSALIGTYVTLSRAEEVAAASHQAFIDIGADPSWTNFTVHPVTFYDE